MTVGRSSKTSYDQVNIDNDADESTTDEFLEKTHGHEESKMRLEKFTPEATGKRHKFTDTETKVRAAFQQAIGSSYCQDETQTEREIDEFSQLNYLVESHWLDSCDVEHMEGKVLPYEIVHTSTVGELSQIKDHHSPSASKAKGLSDHYFDPNGPQSSQTFLSPSDPFPTLFTNHNRAPRPNSFAPLSSRPSFNQLALDGQQGIKVLFFIDHATKGDAIHYNISAYIHSDSPEMKLLMTRYRVHRSRLQNKFFTKARTICAQLMSRHEFLEIERVSGDNKGRRLEYFSEKCTNARLASLYSHLASAVDIPKILTARTSNNKAFKDLMTQVFIHSMEDLWSFEFAPSQHDLPAKFKKESREDMYNRFRDLTDREDGLPAARLMPGYLEVPLKAGFPRYVLFNTDPRPRNRDRVPSSEAVEKHGRKSCPKP